MQQLYVVGQLVKLPPPADITHPQAICVVSSVQVQALPLEPPAPPPPLLPPLPPVPVVV